MPPVAALSDQLDQTAAIRSAIGQALAARNLKLPVLPHVAGRVMTLTQDPNADLADLSSLIHQDQSLAGNVVRIANSAAYCTGEPIVSLRQAVMQLGMTTLSEIAIAACLQGDALTAPGYERLRKEMLAHAFVSAGFAKELARCRRSNVEVAFLCGLLHTIGLPVGLATIARLGNGRVQRPGETEALGLAREFQKEIAEVVTAEWKMPREVQVVAVHHQDPEAAPAFVDETKFTALAGRLAGWFLKPDGTARETLQTLPVWAELNLYPDEVEAVFDRGRVLVASLPALTGRTA